MKPPFLLTKVIATLGPASESPQMIRQLIKEGVDAFRLNFSHGTMEMHAGLISRVRSISSEMEEPVALIGDLSGPKIRIGDVKEGGIELEEGDTVVFLQNDDHRITGNEKGQVILTTNYAHLINEVHSGQRILLDDGAIALQCEGKEGRGHSARLICKVLNKGMITSHKGVNLPDTDLSVPTLTEKDYRYIEFAVAHQLDFLALSFVRSAGDIIILKERLKALGARPDLPETADKPVQRRFERAHGQGLFIPVISKIEKPQALENLEAILQETDLVMVARGDLGVEVELAEVAVHQKRIIHLCHEYGVPVIVATQMLQSMIDAPAPTRAEVSDVANAIFDGADAVMLSGETAVGRYPLEAVRMMNRIAEKTNNYIRSHYPALTTPHHIRPGMEHGAALAHGVRTMVEDIDVKLIINWSQLTGNAIYLSQYHMPIPILAFSNQEEILRKMALLFGLVPLGMDPPKSGSQFIREVDKRLILNKWAEKGDVVIFVLGEPVTRQGISNRLVIHYVGEGD